jgi:hypothetical protein
MPPSIATADLHDELIRHRRGEYSRITIERHRERLRNIEGRNLKQDFESLAPAREAPTVDVVRPPSTQHALGCMALAPHLRMVVWPRKFQPHPLEKYDMMVNPVEFLQIYSTSILTAGGDEAIMANYFTGALTETAQSWLMNLPEGTLTSWKELCYQFMANFESFYLWPSNEINLHAMQQCPGESLRSFIQRFSQVRNTIPRIFNASIVVAFRQGVRDEKMLEKLATHDIQDVAELFSVANKCTRAMPGTTTYPRGREGWQARCERYRPGGGRKHKNKKKKASGNNQPLAGAPIVAATAIVAGGGRGPRGDKHSGQASVSDDRGTRCLVHNSTHHNVDECWEIKKLMEQYREHMKQQCDDGTPSR